MVHIIIPVRCLSCGKPVAHLWETYNERVAKGEKPGAVLDDLGLERYCCRALLLTHHDALKNISRFSV